MVNKEKETVELNLTDDILEAISVLKSGDVKKKSSKKEDGPNLLSIAEKVIRNRGKGQ